MFKSTKKRSSTEDGLEKIVPRNEPLFESSKKKTKTEEITEKTIEDPKTKKDVPEFWELSKMRRVNVNEFKGKPLVNIREYYEKNGEMLPGKKGLSLNSDQWKEFKTQLEEIHKAFEENSVCKFELGNKKFASIEKMKGNSYVDLREYYLKGEELAPGNKGIMLNKAQWDNFYEAVSAIDEVFQSKLKK